MSIYARIHAPQDDWYIRIEQRTPPLRFGPVVGYDVTVYEPGHKVFATRAFRNPHFANEWADSWGLPRSLTEHV